MIIKSLALALAITLLFGITACAQSSGDVDAIQFSSLSEATDYGLKSEKANLLLRKEFKNKHYRLIENHEKFFALAVIDKSGNLYVWNRVTAYLSTPSYIMFSYNQGLDDEVNIIIGKTDKGTKKVKLDNKLDAVEQDVYNGYYMWFDVPKSNHAYNVEVVDTFCSNC
ncbi:hypothetical protein [Paenibacillus agilis]|uniref:Uncharacterized protein n=1 Tax=Paenibacillus agilis TaxID=3020863 RepID=A0A559IW19_9BACL|nr:hypothetical protein [Paenibacillus agilis]TVX91842.1 hypothetical protein FPZ44_01460 [Paenibacillus agilis]